MSKPRILVVEDDSIIAVDIQNELENMGYTVPVIVSSGKDAIKVAEETKPHIVLMDIMLKGDMDGVETAEHIRKHFDIPVIYLTAYSDGKTLQRAKITEPFGYIIKPLESRELHANIEMALYKHKMEKKLRESEQWFLTTLKSIGDAVIATDKKGYVRFMNPVAELLTGWKQEDAIRRFLVDVFNIIDEKTGEQAENPVTRIIRQNNVNKLKDHTILVAKNGTKIPIDHSGAPIRDEKGNISGMVLIFSNIIERKRAEEELRRYAKDLEAAKVTQEENTAKLIQLIEELDVAKRRAEEATRTKSEFLANMSHEIRTPMNGIIGMTELVLDTELTLEQREFLDAVKSSANSLLILINDILDFSKIEAGKLEMESIDFDLRDCLGDVMHTLTTRADEKGLELACHVLQDVPDALVGDPTRVRQIVMNLVSNAIKFTEKGEVVLRVEMESRKEEVVSLHFTVTDTGIGVPTEKQQIIFEAFKQADGSTTRKYGGTGLGLTISSLLVEMMSGRIWVESPSKKCGTDEVGPGSMFHFTASFRLQKSSKKKQFLRVPIELREIPVLVVDDNATSRRILEETLVSWRMKPTMVDNGRAALATIDYSISSGKPIPIVLLDASMPDMGSFALVEKIRKNPEMEEVTIIMLSSSNLKAETVRSRELGISTHLRKPIKQSELFNAIVNTLRQSEEDQKGTKENISKKEEAIKESSKVLTNASQVPINILLAEDNVINRKLAMILLRKRGWQVVAVSDGKEVLRAVEAELFDLILMDVQMPKMDGFETVAAIRRKEESTGTHIPIIAMTAHAMKGDRKRCLDAGMDDYISKPMQAKELYIAIEQLLNDKLSSVATTSKPSIDLSKVIEVVDGDKQLLRELVEDFLKEFPRQLEELRESVEQGDSKQLERKAHRFKGMIGNFGAKTAYTLAYKLENMGRESRLGGSPPILRELEQEMKRVRVFFSNPGWDVRL